MVLCLRVVLVYPGFVSCYHVADGRRPHDSCEECDWDFMISCVLHDILYSSVWHFGSILIKDSNWGNGRCHLTTTVIVFRRSPSSAVLAPHVNCPNNMVAVDLDGNWSRKLYYNFWRQCWKIFLTCSHWYAIARNPFADVKFVAEDLSRLTDIFSHGMKMAAWNRLIFFGHCHYEIALRCNVTKKVVAPSVRPGSTM